MSDRRAAIHVGDTVTYRAHLIDEKGADVDMSESVARRVRFERPDGTRFDVDAVLTETATPKGSDGRMDAPLTPTELTLAGNWRAQPIAQTPAGQKFGHVHAFKVEAGIPAP